MMNEQFAPTQNEIHQSRQGIAGWFKKAAPLLQWSEVESPVGRIYFAVSKLGLHSLDFGLSQEQFIARLDPLARTEQDDLKAFTQQLQEYFEKRRSQFDLPVDFSRVTPFQRSVLDVALAIPAGEVWTYGQVAQHIGRPSASRAVGQALGSNPVPIVVPCHRVIASNGKLTGYSAGAGVASKKWLLQFEGAL